MAETVTVDLGDRSYDIRVGERLLAKAGEYIAPLAKNGQVIVITDENVARFYLHRLGNTLEEHKVSQRSIILKPGEATKSLEVFSGLMETLLEQKPERGTLLVALGGGVIGDIAGFAASVLLRGVDFVQIPTSLLAQVDSSVGGKTGINSRFGKNLIGSFHQPRLVLADISTLATLPKREMLAGYAEILKYALIGDEAFFRWLEEHAAPMLSGGEGAGALLAQAVATSCKAKAKVVAEDEREAGRRALLNFGHTFGHALEAETGFSDQLLHGEAVAIGMVLATQLSVDMKLCPESELARLLAHYKQAGLPASPLDIRKTWDIDALLSHFTRDKKAKGGKPTFILTRGTGKAFIEQAVEIAVLRQALARACHGV